MGKSINIFPIARSIQKALSRLNIILIENAGQYYKTYPDMESFINSYNELIIYAPDKKLSSVEEIFIGALKEKVTAETVPKKTQLLIHQVNEIVCGTHICFEAAKEFFKSYLLYKSEFDEPAAINFWEFLGFLESCYLECGSIGTFLGPIDKESRQYQISLIFIEILIEQKVLPHIWGNKKFEPLIAIMVGQKNSSDLYQKMGVLQNHIGKITNGTSKQKEQYKKSLKDLRDRIEKTKIGDEDELISNILKRIIDLDKIAKGN